MGVVIAPPGTVDCAPNVRSRQVIADAEQGALLAVCKFVSEAVSEVEGYGVEASATLSVGLPQATVAADIGTGWFAASASGQSRAPGSSIRIAISAEVSTAITSEGRARRTENPGCAPPLGRA